MGIFVQRLFLQEITLENTNTLALVLSDQESMKFVKAFIKTVMGKLVVDEVLHMKNL